MFQHVSTFVSYVTVSHYITPQLLLAQSGSFSLFGNSLVGLWFARFLFDSALSLDFGLSLALLSDSYSPRVSFGHTVRFTLGDFYSPFLLSELLPYLFGFTLSFSLPLFFLLSLSSFPTESSLGHTAQLAPS